MTQTTEVAEQKPKTLRQRLIDMGPEFAKALPSHISPDRFIRTAQTALQMSPDVGQAATSSEGGMRSFFASCTKAAQDGLILDGREAALVTFNVKVSKKGEADKWEKHIQYLPMVAGLMKKARNSGEISQLNAALVHKNDAFEYDPGSEGKPIHNPDWFGNRGPAIGVYAFAILKDGSVMVEIMSRDQVMNIAGQSKNSYQYDPERGKNYGEWWRKTAIRRLSKYLPSSADRDEFLRAVERIDEGFDYDQGEPGEQPANQAQPARKAKGAGAAALKDITPAEPRQRPAQAETPHDPNTGEVMDADPNSPDMQPEDDL